MGKRANGEGGITQRKDGLWVGSIRLGNGRRKFVYAAKKGKLIDKMNAIRLDIAQGLPISGPNQTLAEYLGRWLEDVAKPHIELSTWDGYEQLVRLHIAPNLGKLKLDKVSPQHLAWLYNQKLSEGLSPRRVAYIHSVLHVALKRAVRWNIIPRNPADAVDAPKGKRVEIQPLTAEQAQAFLRAAAGDPLEALYVMALATGMRQGELLALQWKAVDLSTGRAQIVRSLRRRKGEWLIKGPKTARSRRLITLPDLALESLKRHRASQLEQRLVSGPEWESNDLVFCNDRGQYLYGTHITRGPFKRLLKRAGLPEIRFHDLRHSAATLLLSEGVHSKLVQELLGHSTITITMDTYSHVLPGLQREVASRMDAVLKPPKRAVDAPVDAPPASRQ